MRVLPVALTSGTRGSSTSACAVSAPPRTTHATSAGISGNEARARARSASHASAVSDAFSEGFQTTVSPHTSAIAAFQPHTAAGKLNAVMTPHTPSGCHVSIMRWPGRSEAMVRP